MTQILRLMVLGRFNASWDGKLIDSIPKKAQALLGFLAAEPDRAHSRDRLATLLWGDTGEERARHNLRQALLKLRRCLHLPMDSQHDSPFVSPFVSRAESLSLNPHVCQADVMEFERLAKSKDGNDWLRCLELYRGDLLDGLLIGERDFEDWLILARGRLRRIACEVSDRLIESLSGDGRDEDLLPVLNRRLSMDPANERAHCELMKLYSRLGRRSDALRQYQICVDALQRELGAEPGDETKHLHGCIQQGQAVPGEQVNSTAGHAEQVASVKGDKPTVAVLPFEILSGNDDGYFVDGIVEDIITALSRFSALKVISRSSTFNFRSRDISDREVAGQLHAQFLVRGSVQRVVQRVRIHVKLLDAGSGLLLWGERFDRELEDVFIVQDEIAATLAATLVGQVEAARLATARKAPPERLDAYDLLLRGKEYHHRFTPEDCRRCIAMFEQAIELDPDYAVAHAWLACGLGQAMVFELDDIPRLVDKSQAAAERGLHLDENESECHRLLAQIYLTRGDLKKSLGHQERALLLNPNDDQSVCSMGEILSFMGRHEEAESWIRKSMQLNPYHPQRYWTHLARPLFHQKKYEQALSALDHISRPRKDDHVYHIAACACLGDQPRLQAGLSKMRQAFPGFDPVALAETLPYENEHDRLAVVNAVAASIE